MGSARHGHRRSSVLTREPARRAHVAVQNQLTDFLSGDLDSTSAASLAAHLAQCTACATDLATFGCTIGLLRTLPPRPAPDALRQRLLAMAAEQAGQAGDTDSPPALISGASCPPHHWLIADGIHGHQHWVCHRCGQQQEHQQRPLRLLRLQTTTTSRSAR
jgi:anti-sigma factor ChrR (cupin superfamily)